MEHILPQEPEAKPKAKGKAKTAKPPVTRAAAWDAAFTAAEQEHWLHRLGNLMLLHGSLNAAASNLPFQEKLVKYRSGKTHRLGSSTMLPLTDNVMALQHWGPAEAAEQQAEQVKLAVNCWRLHDVDP